MSYLNMFLILLEIFILSYFLTDAVALVNKNITWMMVEVRASFFLDIKVN